MLRFAFVNVRWRRAGVSLFRVPPLLSCLSVNFVRDYIVARFRRAIQTKVRPFPYDVGMSFCTYVHDGLRT